MITESTEDTESTERRKTKALFISFFARFAFSSLCSLCPLCSPWLPNDRSQPILRRGKGRSIPSLRWTLRAAGDSQDRDWCGDLVNFSAAPPCDEWATGTTDPMEAQAETVVAHPLRACRMTWAASALLRLPASWRRASRRGR